MRQTESRRGSVSVPSLFCSQHDEIWMASSITNLFWTTIKHRSYNLLISFSTEKHSKQCSAPVYLADWFTIQDNEKKLIFTAPTHCMWGSIQKLLSILLQGARLHINENMCHLGRWWSHFYSSHSQMLYKDKGPSADSPAMPWCMERGTNLLDGASGKRLPARHGPPVVWRLSHSQLGWVPPALDHNRMCPQCPHMALPGPFPSDPSQLQKILLEPKFKPDSADPLTHFPYNANLCQFNKQNLQLSLWWLLNWHKQSWVPEI